MFVNVLYEGDYEDCDIIWVPDFIGCNINVYGQQFCDWLNSEFISNEYYVTIDNYRYTILETEGFVRWLNNNICSKKEETLVYIVKQHTKFDSDYTVVEF